MPRYKRPKVQHFPLSSQELLQAKSEKEPKETHGSTMLQILFQTQAANSYGTALKKQWAFNSIHSISFLKDNGHTITSILFWV